MGTNDAPGGQIEINDLLKEAVAAGASDLHIKVGSPPVFRRNGALELREGSPAISKEEAVRLAFSVMTAPQRELFKKEADLDFAYSISGLGRFRCNAFLQRGTLGLVFRVIPTRIPGIDELTLPPILKKLALEERGLVLVTGTTGSGKSTTLAAMIDHINSTKRVNIMTIEDPVEYTHKDKKSLLNQREVGADTKSFAKALRSALRQDPDVILVGEMRDFDTIQTALMAAETGHLVLSTLHTLDASETVNRIISFFPPYHQHQVRIQLAAILRGITSLRLLPRADGKGRVPAVEVLIATSTIRDCVTDPAKTSLIHDFIEQGKVHYGMQTFDQSILELFETGLITYEEALKQASNPEDLDLKVKGVRNTKEMFDQKGGGDISIERFSR
ncbi:MAG: type IV pilus twitching motility protein PilT [Nitrospiraceae bacterium]|nr:type IV pilus twitching motility protein PilT [Nitrospiraceae bacterium]